MFSKKLSSSKIERGFDKFSDSYSDFTIESKWIAPAVVHDNLVRRNIHPKELIDIGAGTGILSKKFKNDGSIVTAVDISSKMLDELKLNNRADHIIIADAQGKYLPFANEKFDAAVACGLFEFVSDSNNLIKEMARITSKEGIICFTTETEKSFKERVFCVIKAFGQISRHAVHNESKIMEEMSANGLKELTLHRFKAYSNVEYNMYTGRKL